MSPAHFQRQFRAAYGETPYSYLMTRRIERAKALLRRGDLAVTEVCMAVGCTSLGSFSARFTELVGETPTRLPGPRPRHARRRAGLRRQGHHPPEPRAEQDGEARRSTARLELPHGSTLPVASCWSMTRISRCVLSRHARPRAAQRRLQRGLPLADVGAAAQPDVAIVLADYLNGTPADADALAGAHRQGRAERRPLPHRRPRRHLREGARLRRRHRPGADRSAVGPAGLRLP